MVRRKGYFKMISALTVCAALGSSMPVYAAVFSAKDNVKVDSAYAKAESDIIINSGVKEFFNLDKVKKYLAFDYKVPDYIIDGDIVKVIRVYNPADGNDKLEIQFCKKDSYTNWYSIESFKDDPVEVLSKQFKESFGEADATVTDKSIKEIEGKYITITDTSAKDSTKAECDKYFAWQNDNVWYCINYANNESGSISEDEIYKIASSLKNPDEVAGIKYYIDEENSEYVAPTINIYDKDDLKKAVDVLGYTPKLPLKINDKIKVTDALLESVKDINILLSAYSYDKGALLFIQSKFDVYGYEDIADSGYVEDVQLNSKQKADKLSINGRDVFRYKDTAENKIVYQWKENGIYYYFEIYYQNAIENADEVVGEFINAED